MFTEKIVLPNAAVQVFVELVDSKFVVGRGKVGFYFLKMEPLTSDIVINRSNPLILSADCIQYILLNSNMIIGSFFEASGRDWVLTPRKVVFGTTNTTYTPVYGVDSSGILVYRGSEGGLLLVPTTFEDMQFLVRDFM